MKKEKVITLLDLTLIPKNTIYKYNWILYKTNNEKNREYKKVTIKDKKKPKKERITPSIRFDR